MMNRLVINLKQEKGYSLLTILMIVVVMSILGVSLMRSVTSGMKQENMREHSEKALYYAEAGIEYVFANLTSLKYDDSMNDFLEDEPGFPQSNDVADAELEFYLDIDYEFYSNKPNDSNTYINITIDWDGGDDPIDDLSDMKIKSTGVVNEVEKTIIEEGLTLPSAGEQFEKPELPVYVDETGKYIDGESESENIRIQGNNLVTDGEIELENKDEVIFFSENNFDGENEIELENVKNTIFYSGVNGTFKNEFEIEDGEELHIYTGNQFNAEDEIEAEDVDLINIYSEGQINLEGELDIQGANEINFYTESHFNIEDEVEINGAKTVNLYSEDHFDVKGELEITGAEDINIYSGGHITFEEEVDLEASSINLSVGKSLDVQSDFKINAQEVNVYTGEGKISCEDYEDQIHPVNCTSGDFPFNQENGEGSQSWQRGELEY